MINLLERSQKMTVKLVERDVECVWLKAGQEFLSQIFVQFKKLLLVLPSPTDFKTFISNQVIKFEVQENY